MSWEKDLKLKQVDDLIRKLKPSMQYIKPKTGWLRLIRTALGMSARVLAKRVGLTQSRISLIEKGEVDGTITLNTLEKVAEGLNCRIVYFLVPQEESLAKLRENQANKKATDLNTYTECQMELEDQPTSKNYQNNSIAKIKEEYLRNWSVDFWDKNDE
jgi:predicted DNA-binding mobile mystery protein A